MHSFATRPLRNGRQNRHRMSLAEVIAEPPRWCASASPKSSHRAESPRPATVTASPCNALLGHQVLRRVEDRLFGVVFFRDAFSCPGVIASLEAAIAVARSHRGNSRREAGPPGARLPLVATGRTAGFRRRGHPVHCIMLSLFAEAAP